MAEEDDFLYRPCAAGMCKYESLKDGALDLYDIVVMNECLDVQTENRNRVQEAMVNQNGGRR